MTFLRRELPLLTLTLGFLALPAFADDTAQENPPAPVVQAPTTGVPATPPPPAAAPAKPAEPDYPDPRTFTIGAFYWITAQGMGPNLLDGHTATYAENLSDLGKPKQSPGIQVSIPISRTGEIKFESFLSKGDGTQIIGANAPVLFGTQFNQGDLASSQYQIEGAKLYLDDLFFPHKFPVSKLRFKSLWEFQYLRVKSTIDAPYVTAGETGQGSKQIFLPEFGAAAEYAVTPHALLRLSGAGFGLYHRADIWDADASLSYRIHDWEIFGGYKVMHFKTSPQSDEFIIDTLRGAYAGVRWHW